MFLAPAGPCNVSRIAGVGSISWEYSPMSRPRSRVQKPHGNVTRGGDGPLEGPPRGYKLHCSLVLAAMVKVFNGILLPLPPFPRSEFKGIKECCSFIIRCVNLTFFKTVPLLLLRNGISVIFLLFIGFLYHPRIYFQESSITWGELLLVLLKKCN